MSHLPAGFWDKGNLRAVQGGSRSRKVCKITIVDPCFLFIYDKEKAEDFMHALSQNKANFKFTEYEAGSD